MPTTRESSAESVVPRQNTKGPVTSDALLGERGELKIAHKGELYSLRCTRQGKLILTR